MCVIVIMDKKIPSLDVFKNCEEKNGHGGGISWVEDGVVHWKKGIKYKEMHDIATEKGVPCIAHFRISTVGGTPPELCHPFVVDKSASTELEGQADSVLFHNGHWKDWESACMNMILNKNYRLPGGMWSDSRALAWLTACSNDTFLLFTEQRVAIQTPTEIIQYGDWKEKDGVQYSNLNWEQRESHIGFWKDKEWKGYKNNVGWNSYGGVVYGIDSKGNKLIGDPEPKSTKKTEKMTDKEIEEHYTQMALEYEMGRHGL